MYEYNCDIRRVVDGDTVDVDIDLGFGIWIRNERVRLYGVDTPESRTRDLVEKKYGILAKEYVEAALSNGAILRTHKDKSGKFGRVLGDFIIYDGVEDRQNSLNAMLVRDHHAVQYTGQSKELIAEKHIANRALVKEFLAK
jgi:micrococcal nuclease